MDVSDREHGGTVGTAVHHGKSETPGAVAITCGGQWACLDCRACLLVEVGSAICEMQTSLH